MSNSTLDFDMDKVREQMELQKRLDKIKYKAERFAMKDMTGGDLAIWLNEVAANGFVYRDALPTEAGFVVIVERRA